MLQVMLLYALFASVYVVAKMTLDYASPIFIVGSRMFMAGVILVGYRYVVDRYAFKLGSKNYWTLFQLAIFNIYFTNIFAFVALQDLRPFESCFIYSLSPFISALFSYFCFSEEISEKKWIGLIIGCLGFIPMLLYTNSDLKEIPTATISNFWSVGMMLLSVISSVYGWILLKQLVHGGGITPTMANGVSMLIGGLVALVHSFFIESWNPLPLTNPVSFLECSLFLIIISNFVCYNLYGVLLKRYSATFMSLAGFMTPLFTALFGWIFLDNSVEWSFFLSAMIVFVGLLLFYQDELKSSDPLLIQNKGSSRK
jgi:drug/metabolite transporter (DMT)-like permease